MLFRSSEFHPIKSDLQLLTDSIAHTALKDRNYRDYIGDQLDLSDEELERVFQYLENKLNEGESK